MCIACPITIVIPTYNVADYIEHCIASISVDLTEAIEILIIDDGSTDATNVITQDLCTKNNSVRLITKLNGGCASARMAGLRAATGKYICFIDADDWVEPSFLQDLLTACTTHQTPIATCFYNNCYEADKTQAPAYPHSFLKGAYEPLQDGVIPSAETLLWKPTIWASLFEREFLLRNKIEFPEHVRMFDDLAFHAQIAFSGAQVAIVPKHLYNYRLQRPGQDVANRGQKLFVHFDIFEYLNGKLTPQAKASMDYFLLKYQTHRWTLSIIDQDLKAAYRAKAARDLFHHLDMRDALRAIKHLSKIKRRFGRDALALLVQSRLENGLDSKAG